VGPQKPQKRCLNVGTLKQLNVSGKGPGEGSYDGKMI